ncbi:hypothetical protein W97_01642 [Coniosporium apollinis CBS 100218]|uniref:DUF7580 domain-containing protein n=1 Tax=Coniosporium apollinis (strain CBS 100218) TaxID=1168221 RepID=R7YKI6_CONA1|nr:uncharacterized protein W97_01642 [Coniosporium apollinis CBS 100218]EON62420.1 hypothetical protein W97_01642 [Coniosporium apollinis CBS 100218]
MSGIEITGLVFGAIPIILAAIDLYLGPVKGIRHYNETLEFLRINLFIQQRSLDASIDNLGLGRNPVLKELEENLKENYPDDYEGIAMTIRRMERLLLKLMDKLEIDVEGKPKCPPNRAKWEWRRVKNGFGKSEHEQIINELERYNLFLARIFEKPEASCSDPNDQQLQRLRDSFDPVRCSIIRKEAVAIHQTLEGGWKCTCSQPHEGSIRLDWYDSSKRSPTFDIAFSYHEAGASPNVMEAKCWCATNVRLETAAGTSTQVPSAVSAKPSSSAVAVTKSAAQGSSSNDSRAHRRLAPMGNICAAKPPQKQSVSFKETKHSTVSPSNSTASSAATTPMRCLCEAIRSTKDCDTELGFLKDPDAAQERRTLISTNKQLLGADITSAHLGLLLPAAQKPPLANLSLKERCRIAAAVSWMVLHLCGSPWLKENWDKGDIHLFLQKVGPTCRLLTSDSFISCAFRRATTPMNQVPSNPAAQFQNSLIRNRVLFNLGILLIELSHSRPFEHIRKDHQLSAAPSAPSLDFAIADAEWGIGVFQYPPGRDVWSHRVPYDTDILLTCGPPKGHLNCDRLGNSRFLLSEIWRMKPRLVVFGHIHGGYGQEETTFDAIQATYDRVLPAGKGLFEVVRMVYSTFIQRMSAIMPFSKGRGHSKKVTCINTAVVARPRNKLTRPAIKS